MSKITAMRALPAAQTEQLSALLRFVDAVAVAGADAHPVAAAARAHAADGADGCEAYLAAGCAADAEALARGIGAAAVLAKVMAASADALEKKLILEVR